MLGMASGGVVAYYASGGALRIVSGLDFLLVLGAGTLAAGILNAASNALNQIFDLKIDRINKPNRPLCTGAISVGSAGVFGVLATLASLALAAWISWTTGNWATLALFGAATVFSIAYSAPPLRMKARGWLANLTIALPRGTLLKVAGWSLAASILSVEAWYIGAIMGLFLLGATSTKDFADMKGDAAQGVRTLPVAYGARKAAKIITPFLIVPWIMIPAGGQLGILTPPLGQEFDLIMLGLVCVLWGAHVAVRVLENPEALTRTENHPAWRHMYYLMLFVQIGFAFAYVPYSTYREWMEMIR
jgi:4-hydroxybenzoate polyprenyltransferase